MPKKVELALIDAALRNIQRALEAGDLKVSMWVLERLRPEVWGKRAGQATQAQVVDLTPQFAVLDGSERAKNAS
ncbi:MAG: hypothetical protein NZ556_08040 [Fimbriimonadales bacterium]|nr:hypothetical protein [Fimbriimonadales bacterium]